uniref:Integrase, catalytic region, zinc finger, CCHC-type, peptidase aspartic, catalytic n=1 Tax=Tanacetum cinerariifolium TaxID=118510 RepID=A0A6L2L7K6_TANCI|nr:integrase, catalytic region, zinc finger, CCHC-type, peptidase aspartic, catalytic [Tanacetum cinerariifolium]
MKSIVKGPYQMGTKTKTLAGGVEGALQLGLEHDGVFSDLTQEEKDRNLNYTMTLNTSARTKEKTSTHIMLGEQVTNFNDDVDDPPEQDLALNVDHVFKADQYLIYNEVGPSYDSDIPSEVQDHENSSYSVYKHQDVHEMQNNVQQDYVANSNADFMSYSNIIPYDQYVEDNAEHNLKAQLKGKTKCVTIDPVKPKVLAPGMYAIDVDLITPRLKNNRDAHSDYLKHLKESVETVHEIVEEARLEKSLDNVLAFACSYIKRCSKHMMRNLLNLKNFMSKFIGTVRFGNDHFGAIIGQFYDSDLEVSFKKHSCFVHETEGVDLLKGSRSTNLYTISVDEMMKSSPICLLSKASKNKSWLWNHRLNHLNFGTINDLVRKDMVRGLPRLKFEKEFYERVVIFHQKSLPRTPQQNSVVNRRNCSLVEAARTMLIFSKALMFLWAKAQRSWKIASNCRYWDFHCICSQQEGLSVNSSSRRSAQLSSRDVGLAEPNQVNLAPDHLRKWSKDHPLDNIVGNPSRLIHGAGESHEDANQKFLRSLPSSWSQVALIIRTKPGLDTFRFDDLYNNQRVFEHDVKEDHLAKFYKMDDAKEMWEAIKSKFGGNNESKKMQKYLLKQQFEGFFVSALEGLHKRSLPSSWSQVALIIRTKPGLDTFRFDDLYNNQRVFEHDVKGTIISSSSSSNTQNVAFVSFDNTSRTNDVEAQLLCHQQNQLAYEQKIRFMKIDLDDKTNVLAYHKKLLAEALKEKEDLKTKFENWQNSSKNLSRLLNTQMSANDKLGLRYGNYRYGSTLSYENEVLQNVFMNKESDLEITSVNDRYAEGMHAVPPLMTGNYMPFGLDVEIDYSKFTYGPKQTSVDESDAKTSEYSSCKSNFSVETTTSMPAPVKNAPTDVYEPKVWTDAPIIKEYEPDYDDDSVSNVQKDKDTPSFAFTNFVKHVKTSRENVKETGTPNHCLKVEKHDRNGHTRKGLGYAFTRKACFVCGSSSHLIRDCDFHEKRMAKQAELTKSKNKFTGQRENRPVWNNAQRVNHQNKFVPSILLTKTSKFQVNAAR